MKPADDVKQSTPDLTGSCKSICYLALGANRPADRTAVSTEEETLRPGLVLISHGIETTCSSPD